MAVISGNYALNAAADDTNSLTQLINIRCGVDAPIMTRLLLGSTDISTANAQSDSNSLLSSGVIDSSNSINSNEHLLLTQKHAAITQIAAQFHVDAPQTEATADDNSSKSTALPTPTTITTSNLQDFLKPVSSFIGSTLGALTGMNKGATGSGIPNTVQSFLERTDSKSPSTINSAYQSLKLDEINKMPTSVLGSLNTLSNANSNASTPSGTLLNDVYGGTQGTMQKINKLKTTLLVNVEKSVFHALDSIIPAGSIAQFTGIISQLSNKLPSLAANFNGLGSLLKFSGNYQESFQQFNSVLSNPQKLMYQYSIPKMNSFQTTLYNPNEALEQYLPSNLKTSIGKVSSISSIGLGGSMGGGLFNQLESLLKGQVIQNILQMYPSHTNLITPMLKSGAPTQPPTYSVAYRQSSYPTSTTFDGEIFRQPDYTPSPLFDTTDNSASGSGFSLATTTPNTNPLSIN